MLQQQMGGQGMGIQPQNMPSSQGLRMPGSSSGLGYGSPGALPNQPNLNPNPNPVGSGSGSGLGLGSQSQPQQNINPNMNPSQPQPMSQQPLESNSQPIPNNNSQPSVPIQQQPLFAQPQPQMQLSPEMLALSLNPQFQMIKAQVQQNPN